MIRFVLVFVAILPWLLLFSESSSKTEGTSIVSMLSVFKWRELRDLLWEGRNEFDFTLDSWPETENEDECLDHYRDAKHNDICVISS
ncbi:hypothetical protein PHMEG_00011876 [Phytophthora megakarya]|uniref:RxLR effector protein n=1 Tax=Phytophthora megakarya TaxID=4795 RepID=A0A225WA67_9STRA|nr:hypothetical protein PHMEG_00011876 [Phytophthora megakarya]